MSIENELEKCPHCGETEYLFALQEPINVMKQGVKTVGASNADFLYVDQFCSYCSKLSKWEEVE